MDKELENFVEEIMEKQVYRNGIFTSWIDDSTQCQIFVQILIIVVCMELEVETDG